MQRNILLKNLFIRNFFQRQKLFAIKNICLIYYEFIFANRRDLFRI